MPSCIVRGCTFQWKNRDPNIILHAFPSNVDIIRSWLLQFRHQFDNLDQMCCKVLTATKGTYRICSQHFTEDCYYHKGMRLALKKEALPTIFPDEKAIANKAKAARKRRRRGDVPWPGDPSPPPELDCGKASVASSSSVGGFPLKVIKVEYEDQAPPMSVQEAEPEIQPTLISEDGYYISMQSYNRLRERGVGCREAFLERRRSLADNAEHPSGTRP